MSIAGKVVKNSSANLISYAWNMLFFIFLTPIMLNKLGSANYGIIALTASLTGFLGFMDLGFTGAAVKQISENYAKKNYKRINDTINLSLLIYIILGTLACIILIIIIKSPLLYYFKIDKNLLDNLKFSLYVASINIIVNMILGVFANVLYALQMNVLQAKIDIFLSTISNVVLIIFLFLGFGLKTVMVLKLMTSLIGLLVFYLVDKRVITQLTIKIYFEKNLFKEMFSFSIYNVFTQISQSLFGQFDRIVISSFTGVTAVTYYVVPMGVSIKIFNIISTMSNVIFPLTSELSANNKSEEIRVLYQKAMKYITFISFTIIVPVYIYSRNILELWVGADFATNTYNILRIFLVSFLLASSNIVSYFMFNGLNLPKLNAIYTGISCLARAGSCIVLIPIFGEIGAAVSFFISIIPAPFFALYFEKILNIKNLYFILKVYLPSFIIASIVVFIFTIFKYNGVNIIVLLFLGILSSALYCVSIFLVKYFDDDDIKLGKSIINKFVNRFSN